MQRVVGTDRQSGGVSAEKGEKKVILGFTCNGLTRRIQRVENAVVAVRQDSNVDTVRMIFRPEEYNNINLASVSVKFLYVDTDGEIKAYQTGTTPDGGVYVADWELTDDVVDDAGYINFAVKLAVVNGDTVEKQWFSIPDTFRVYDSVDDTNNPPGETAAEQATNAEKIAQLQSQLGTATSELEGLTNTVALHGAALDTIGTNTWALRGGVAIPANENIDNYFTEGNYGVQSSDTARTLSGLPFETGSGNIFAFVLKVENAALNDNSARRQILQFYNDRQQWIRYGSVNGTWTAWERQPSRAEMDALTWTALPSGADLNDYTTPGRYYTTSKAETGNIVNKPSGMQNPLTLEVQKRGAYCTQVLYDYYGALYTRATITSGWTQWFKYEGVHVS